MLKKGLGKGLQALIPEAASGDREALVEVEIARIYPNPKQPRRSFDEEKLLELAASIKEHGVVQPVLLRRRGEDFELVAGERRWRASQKAGLDIIPALIKDFSEAQMMEIALIENLQREDLNPVEEALAYRTLINEFGLTQEQLAQRLGKSRPQISNTLRLLALSEEVQDELAAGRLSMGHAKVLLGVEDRQAQERLARRIMADALSVREVEQLVKNLGSGRPRPLPKRKSPGADPELSEVEERLRQALGTPVKIVPGRPKGRIEVNYYGIEDLDRIVGAILGSDQRPEAGLRPTGRPFRI